MCCGPAWGHAFPCAVRTSRTDPGFTPPPPLTPPVHPIDFQSTRLSRAPMERPSTRRNRSWQARSENPLHHHRLTTRTVAAIVLAGPAAHAPGVLPPPQPSNPSAATTSRLLKPLPASVLTADALAFKNHDVTLANPFFEGRAPGNPRQCPGRRIRRVSISRNSG